MKRLFQFIAVAVIFLGADLLIFNLLYGGVVRYYGLDKPAGIVCVGHSHTVLGIDSELLETELGTGVSKYAIAGANALDRYWMIRHYLEINPGVTTVVYDVDSRLFDADGLSSASYSLFLPFIGDPVMRTYLKEQALPEEYRVSRLVRTARFRDQVLNIALRGLLDRNETRKSTTVNPDQHKAYLASERERLIRIDPDSAAYFMKTVDFVRSRGKTMFLVHIPVIDLLGKIDPEGGRKAIDIFQAEARKDHVFFLDYAGDYAHRHDLFFDLRHLNEKGKRLITSRLADDIRRISEDKADQ